MVKDKEFAVLRQLRGNSRDSLAKISKRTTIPVSTVFDILKKMEKDVITRHVSLIDFSKVGYGIRVLYILRAVAEKQMRDFLMNTENVNTLSFTHEDYFCAECVFRNMKEVRNFKDEIEGIGVFEYNENIITEEVKKEEFCSV
jgi:DNA-binding Lrp family transcriptional regulator